MGDDNNNNNFIFRKIKKYLAHQIQLPIQKLRILNFHDFLTHQIAFTNKKKKIKQ